MEIEVRPLKMTEKMADLVNRYWQDVWESRKDGRLLAWISGGFPFEFIRAMDIAAVWPENYGGVCSMADISTELCQKAEAVGYSQDLCSVVRNCIGFTHGAPAMDPKRLPFGGMPRPDIMLCMPYCPGIYKMWEKYSRFFDVPLLVMERPRLHDTLTEEELAHFVNDGAIELEEMVKFVEKFAGRRLDYDRLCQMLTLEWESARLRMDGVEMCRNIPAPMSVFDQFRHIFPFYLYRGMPEAVTYYQELNAELAERIAEKIGPVAVEEKYRLYWDNLPIFNKEAGLTQKFASHGAVPVVAAFPYFFGYMPELDLERPLKSLTELMFINPSNRGLKGRIDFITKLVKDYSLDGFVMQRSRTCLVNTMGQDDIMNAMIEKTGLPAVVIEGDLCDSRFFSDSDVNSKIDAFMEILEQRGPRNMT